MTETAKLTASDAQQFDELGYSVSINVDTIALGAVQRASTGSGKVYIYVRPALGWTSMSETAKLTAASASFGDVFGESVSLTESKLIVGAGNSNQVEGAAYLYIKPVGGWSTTSNATTELTPPNGTAGEGFGFSAFTSGGAIAVGAPFPTNCSCALGLAYVFQP